MKGTQCIHAVSLVYTFLGLFVSIAGICIESDYIWILFSIYYLNTFLLSLHTCLQYYFKKLKLAFQKTKTILALSNTMYGCIIAGFGFKREFPLLYVTISIILYLGIIVLWVSIGGGGLSWPTVKKFEKVYGIEETCSICLDDMSISKELACGHKYHEQCINEWLATNPTCPYCRQNV